LGSTVLLYAISKRFFGVFSARIIAILFSTSAGIISFSHFLTADIPVMFWMIVAFYFTQNILLKRNKFDYIFAGLFTGIATATKYNGLAVGIAIVVAHCLSFNAPSARLWKEIFLNKKLFLGLSMVIVGFLIANPFALIDYAAFLSDFAYNYKVTPVYYGTVTGHSYWKFFLCCMQVIGLPSLILLLVASLFSLYHCIVAKDAPLKRKFLFPVLSVCVLYYCKFGSFPRMENRFVLPVLPFFFILTGHFWNVLKPKKIILSVLLSITLSYNLVCSFYVGKRFVEDPRMKAQEWVKKHIKAGSSIESSSYVPNWNKLPGIHFDIRSMPAISGRRKQFEKIFSSNVIFKKVLKEIEKDDNEEWYSSDQLMNRRPEYIAIDSLYYRRFLATEIGDFYPSIRKYFRELLDEQYPYKIVFDKKSKKYAKWIYPRRIDALFNRITIFQRQQKGSKRSHK
jgi:hypothetical protein